jgi:dipeptidyl aminopeptidase/acylaminoacyl peptidase
VIVSIGGTVRYIFVACLALAASNAHGQVDAPYGSWASKISIADVTQSSASLDGLMVDGGALYALEQRPAEQGRTVVVKIGGTQNSTITPDGFDVGSRVHEYGGGAALVRGGVVYFSNRKDNRLYAQKIGEAPRPLTEAGPWRYADCDIIAQKSALICVREDHSNPAPVHVKNTLVSIPLNGGIPVILYNQSDFVASPRVSEDGREVAFIAWNHPNMPWDSTALMTGALSDDARGMKISTLIAATKKESIMQPMWGPYGALFYVSDRSGYWNIYRKTATGTVVVGSNTVDIGGPAWTFGQRAYVPLSFDRVAAAVTRNAVSRLAIISASANRYTYTESDIVEGQSFVAIDDRAYLVASTAARKGEVVSIGSAADVRTERASDMKLSGDDVSRGGEVLLDNRNGQKVFAWYYPPRNAAHTSLSGELPPLIVLAHGGPTSHRGMSYNTAIQFWTSRGFAMLDVNYSGSSGYGRVYRQRLNGQWGDLDVADVAYAAMALAQQGKVDRKRMVIMGGSAGGLVVLSALATYPDVFAAGVNSFGVSDFASLATDTHKFESRYLDKLVGPYPKSKKLYDARSPINHVQDIMSPLLTLQGEDDKIVPPSQSEKIVNALRQRKTPVAYVTFAGEGHGFRSGAAKQQALEHQMSFLSQILNLKFADPLPPLAIENWPPQK